MILSSSSIHSWPGLACKATTTLALSSSANPAPIGVVRLATSASAKHCQGQTGLSYNHPGVMRCSPLIPNQNRVNFNSEKRRPIRVVRLGPRAVPSIIAKAKQAALSLILRRSVRHVMRFTLRTSSVTKAGPSHCIVANAVPHPIGDSWHQTGSTLITKVKEA